MDVSSSVKNHWEDEKSFVKKLLDHIIISPHGGHVSVTTFANRAKLMIKFSDHEDASSFETALDALPYWGSTTKIDLGIEVALQEMFKESNGMRSDVTKTMVLITDGQQTGVDFDSWRKKFNAARIRVLVVGVGNVRKIDLKHLLSDDADFYIAKDFDQLLTPSFMKSIKLCGGKILFVNSKS